MMFSDRHVRWLASLDRPGTALDKYIESMQLHRFDVSRGFQRGPDLWANFLAFDEYWRDSDDGNVMLFATERSEQDVVDLDRLSKNLPDNVFIILISRHYRRSPHEHIVVIGAAVDGDDEFDAKCGAHLARFVRLQPEGSPLNPLRGEFPRAVRSYGSLGDFTPSIDWRGVVSIEDEGIRYEFFSSLRSESRLLIVIGQSALVRSQVGSLPVFQRWSWAEDIPNSSVLVLNDPNLYLDEELNAGWWFGTHGRDTAAEMAGIVDTVRRELGLDRRQVVFYGGSAGGFASFHMASCLPGSLAVVDIPQIDMRKYHLRAEADRAAQVAFGVAGIDATPSDLLYRVDVTERFARQRCIPDHLYLQNVRDRTHVVDHYGYFVEKVVQLAHDHSWAYHRARVEMYSYWSLIRGGHFPLNRADTMQRITEFAHFEVAPGAPDRSGWI